MSLPMNTTYSNANQAMSSMVNKLSTISRSMPKNKGKTVDTSQYSGLVNNVKSNLGPVGKISTDFLGSTKYEPGGTHMGTDYAARMGTPIPAYASGTVTESVTGKKHGDPGYGNYLKILGEDGKEWRYSHLEKNFIPVGTRVQTGQTIGTVGATGSTYSASKTYDPNNPDTWGSHLDLRIYDTYKKYFLNPQNYI